MRHHPKATQPSAVISFVKFVIPCLEHVSPENLQAFRMQFGAICFMTLATATQISH